MIFRTINDEATGATRSIGLFGKSFSELKNIFSSIKSQGLINTLFNTSIINEDVIVRYNSAIIEATANNATMAEKQQIMKSAMESTNKATAQLIESTNGTVVSTEALTAAQNQSTLAARAQATALKAASIAGNVLASIGLTLVISKALSFINEMISANEDLLNSAKELSSEFKETESSINGYKEKIKELHETINDSSSSISDVTQARKDLMVVQDELIKKFGTEKDTINIVTQAINGQAAALDYLSERQYQEWKNNFNDKTFGQFALDFFSSGNLTEAFFKLTEFDFQGAWDMLNMPTESNIDKMVNSMQHAFYEIEKTGNQTLDDLISKTFDISPSTENFILKGNLDDIYEDLLEIQELSKDFKVSNEFETDITRIANVMDETLKAYKDSYKTYILYEKILDNSNNIGYDDRFNQINEAKKSYNDAVTSGDEKSIKVAGEKYSETLQSAISLAIKNSDNDVADYFRSMYPEMQQIFAEWSFELNFDPNTGGLKDKVVDSLDKIDGKSDGVASLSSEDILNFNPSIATQEQINVYGELKRVAEEYGFTVENLIAILEKMGLIKSENYQQLVDTFGQELVDTLNNEDLQFAFSVSRDSIKTWDELIAKINEAKEQAAKESEITSVSDALTKLADPEAIDKYNEKISTLQSYLEKLENGSFNSVDESSLITDFGITGNSVEELTEKIQDLMDSELDSIIKQIDDILINAYKTNNISFLNMIIQSAVNKNENTLLNLLDKIDLYSNNIKVKARKCVILAELSTRLAYYGLKPIAKPV